MALTDSPLLTVLIPVYNAAPYIVAAVRSVLSQGVDDLEVLIVDDGSTDGSVDALAEIDDPRVRVVSQPNGGLVSALNRGLDEVRGVFLARMDADDLCAPGRLQAQLDWFAQHPDAVVCGTDYELFGAMSGRVRMPRSDAACRHRLLLAGCLCGASAMMRTEVLRRTGIRFDPEFTHAEDYEFYARLSEYGEIGNIPMVGYLYRIHPGQVSDRHADAQRAAHLRIAAAHAVRVGARPLPDAVLSDLLWPDRGGVLPTAGVSTVAAARALLRDPGVETARFGARRVLEATLAARRGE
ncbi:glycosyltransferase [Gordonia desulfuricans]|uniref:Glycosyltransferase n=1 Tax=Gordonia desulfuricans TaxID=89051 RepID=A0A7K3LW13_9ACTN|nr:glycosyltransferase [Gordonia desulfuricans]NDK92296.1 glycosyltransferase [Gordonia desulfuricans]